RDKSPLLGGRAILQAVTRVKLEQASKVKLWMPTRLLTGEGRTNGEETDQAPVRSTGVLSTACRKSGLRKFGRPGAGGGRTFSIIRILRGWSNYFSYGTTI